MVGRKPEPEVKVHHTQGCALCSRTDVHTHAQQDWRELIDNTPLEGTR